MPRLAFDESYAEQCVLDDGTAVELRLVRPDDKPLMLAAWERLSPESRYRRFFSAKGALTSEELRYLTELDNVHHLAIGASCRRGGETVALGVARFVRMTDQPDMADAAVTVVDDFQRLGLGRLLLTRLVAAARERGIERFRCDVLATNEGMRRLLRSLAPVLERPEGPLVTVELPLADVVPAPGRVNKKSLVYRLLALVGRG